LRRVQREELLDKDVVLPIVTEIIHVLEPFARFEAKVGQSDLIGMVSEADAAFVSDTVLLSVDDKSVQMTIQPTHDHLHGFVKCPDRRVTGNQNPPPHGRLDASQDDLELVHGHCHLATSNVERTDRFLVCTLD
jgi:hypothetical protein